MEKKNSVFDFNTTCVHFTAGMKSDRKLVKKISKIDEDFDLVMITERMEESLVLLADLLCWPLAYMASLKKNSRMDSAKVSQKK